MMIVIKVGFKPFHATSTAGSGMRMDWISEWRLRCEQTQNSSMICWSEPVNAPSCQRLSDSYAYGATTYTVAHKSQMRSS